ncbi:MAG: hypothetical protein WCE46_05455 [Methanoregula sp.]|uniref:hypothetical protein n=1 Tax=Methanoregula sp. TaxID=2052170 RepID=UPI003C7688EB
MDLRQAPARSCLPCKNAEEIPVYAVPLVLRIDGLKTKCGARDRIHARDRVVR